VGYLAPHLKKLTDKQLKAARHDELEEMSLSETVDSIRVIRRLAQALDQTPEDELPDNARQRSHQLLEQLVGIVDQMVAFTLVAPNAHQTRQQLQAQVKNHYDTWRTELRPHIRAEVGALAQLRDLQEQDEALHQLRERAAATAAEADALLEKVQRLAGEVGAGQLSKHYRDQADDYRATAKWFLIVSGGLAILLGVLSWILFSDIETGGEWTEFAREALARLFFLGIVGYALTFAVRGYRANTHLRVVNQQKANALDTYILFQESATSEVGKEAITLELVRAVFSQSDSGFLDGGSDRTIIEEQGAPMMGLLAARINSGK
jgi:hypothetical protein